MYMDVIFSGESIKNIIPRRIILLEYKRTTNSSFQSAWGGRERD